MDYLVEWTRPLFIFIETVLRDVPGVLPALLSLPVVIVVASRQGVHILACLLLVAVSIIAAAGVDRRPDLFALSVGTAVAAWAVAIFSFNALKTARMMRELLEQTGALHAEAEGLRLHAERAALASLRPMSAQQPTGEPSAATPIREREFPVSRLNPSNRPTG